MRESDVKDCLFCKMIAREVPAKIIAESDTIFAFADIRPQAPHHVLIIPKTHINNINDLTPDNVSKIGDVLLAARDIAKTVGVSTSGFRLVFNTNADAGQSVFHIHAHFLAGRAMEWPPG